MCCVIIQLGICISTVYCIARKGFDLQDTHNSCKLNLELPQNKCIFILVVFENMCMFVSSHVSPFECFIRSVYIQTCLYSTPCKAALCTVCSDLSCVSLHGLTVTCVLHNRPVTEPVVTNGLAQCSSCLSWKVV